MERLLGSAQELSEKVASNESAAGELLRQCEALQQELHAMRQYRETIQELNGGEQSRVRLPNIELSYIKQLQQDNSELRTLVEEHQAALEMIMSKYRQQLATFMCTSPAEDTFTEDRMAEELRHRTDQVYDMAAVMYHAARVEDSSSEKVVEQVARLEYENRQLRELLQFSTPVLDCNTHPPPVSQKQWGTGGKAVGESRPQNCLGRNELHPRAHTAVGNELVNSVGEDRDDTPCPTPPARVLDPVPLLELARERLSDSKR